MAEEAKLSMLMGVPDQAGDNECYFRTIKRIRNEMI